MNFELNKIIASLLLAALICMLVGNLADVFYTKGAPAVIRGFSVAVTGDNKGDLPPSQAPEPLIDIAALMAKASVQLGKEVAKKCISCHNLNKGEANKIGPHLWDVVNRDKASVSDYSYSKALKNKGGKWDYESLFGFLKQPSKYAPGTKMSFAGLAKPEDVANIVAFLRSQSDNPAPLP